MYTHCAYNTFEVKFNVFPLVLHRYLSLHLYDTKSNAVFFGFESDVDAFFFINYSDLFIDKDHDVIYIHEDKIKVGT